MPHPQVASEASRVTRGIAALFKQAYGRGPDKIKAYVHNDSVFVLMRGGFTPAEETLREAGEGRAVTEQRSRFQEVMRQRFATVVEEATGRTVVGFMSGIQQDPDLQCEIFVLDANDLLDGETAGGLMAGQ